MHYFGTDLVDKGHYFWVLSGNSFLNKGRVGFGDIPFNPENLPLCQDDDNSNGTVEFYNAFGYSIIAIQGSCRDSRPGSKSIFWIKERFRYEDMKDRLLAIPIAKKIFEQMPFEVNF